MFSSTISIWLDAIRPRTLPLAIISILLGSALAYKQAQFSFSVFSLAIMTALLLQILSNLANDYGDTLKGTDNNNRIGPKRAMQQGLVSPSSMKNALSVTIALILVCGALLIFHSLQDTSSIISFIALGLAAIFAAIFYTIGNKPYGYLGLGDLSVLIFFGWLGVLGSFYLHTGSIDYSLIPAATASGLLAVAVLNINNLRDFANDKACGKLTLVVRIGEKNGRIYHLAILSLAFSLFALHQLIMHAPLYTWLFLLSLPFAIKHGKAIWLAPKASHIQPMLVQMVKLAICTNLLFIMPNFF